MTIKKYMVPVIAIIAITILEISALIAGLNGTVFLLSASLIAGLAGYEIKSLKG